LTAGSFVAEPLEPEPPEVGAEDPASPPPVPEPLEPVGEAVPLGRVWEAAGADVEEAAASGVGSGEEAGGSLAGAVDAVELAADAAWGSTSFRCGRADAASV
jgi:hypothetical protein